MSYSSWWHTMNHIDQINEQRRTQQVINENARVMREQMAEQSRANKEAAYRAEQVAYESKMAEARMRKQEKIASLQSQIKFEKDPNRKAQLQDELQRVMRIDYEAATGVSYPMPPEYTDAEKMAAAHQQIRRTQADQDAKRRKLGLYIIIGTILFCLFGNVIGAIFGFVGSIFNLILTMLPYVLVVGAICLVLWFIGNKSDKDKKDGAKPDNGTPAQVDDTPAV